MTKCIRCQRNFAESYIYNHLREAHGIYGGKTGRKRRTPKEMAIGPRPTPKPEIIESKNGKVAPEFEVLPFIVLGDKNGGVWLAERIR